MKAVGYTHCHPVEHPEALIDLDLLAPVAPKGRDLLVEIRAVSVNPVDTKVRRRDDPVGEPKILGYDAAGVVRAIGPDCTLFGPGDPVFYAGVINRSGSNAELHLVDERIVGRKPKTLSFGEAAALIDLPVSLHQFVALTGQLVGHAVEGAAQRGDLVIRGAFLDPHRKIAAAHPLGRVDQLADRAGQLIGQHQAD